MKSCKLLCSFIILLGVIARISAQEPVAPETLLPVADHRDAYTPCAAYGKEVFLVCWQSGRLAKGDLRKGVTGESDIVGLRVGRDGKAVDDKPFVVSTAKNKRQSPRTAFGGGVFLVVWHDLCNGKDWDILAARVSPEGKVLDPDGIAVCSKAGVQALPRVAWDGNAFQIVWQDYRCGDRYEVYGARVSPEGKVLDADGNLLVTQKDRHRFNPVVAPAAEGKSFVIWNGDIRLGTGTIAGGLFLTDGKVDKSVAIDSGGRKHGPGFEWVPFCLARGRRAISSPGRPTTRWAATAGPPTSTRWCWTRRANRRPPCWWVANPSESVIPRPSGTGRRSWLCGMRPSGMIKDKILVDAVFTSRISADGKVTGLTRLAGGFAGPAA
jgi:hypothetical protein